MGFFDDGLEPDRDAGDDEVPPPPEWLQAPEAYIAGVVPTQLIVARNDEAAVVVSNLSAFHSGFSFEAHLFTREERQYDGFEALHRRPRSGEPPPDEVLRLGIEFSDGRRAANVGSMMNGSTFALA